MRVQNAYFREALPVLVLTGIGGVVAGLVLERMSPVLVALPGLLVLVPAIIGLRGNINTTLGSRLGSAVHLGVIDPERPFEGRELRANVNGSLILSATIPVLAGLAAWGTSRVLELPTVSVWALVTIALVSGIVSGVLLALVTVGLVLMAFRYGLDPDNITGPGLAVVGDVITLLVLYVTAAAVLGGWS